MIIDDFDRAILRIVQRDCSLPLREIAARVNLSTAAVQRRVKQLQKAGVIRYQAAVLDPEMLGQVITLIVEVHADRTQSPDMEALKNSFSGPEVQQCYSITGEADFLLILTVASMTSFQELCQRLFHDNANIKWFRTIVVLERVKTTLQVPINQNRTLD